MSMRESSNSYRDIFVSIKQVAAFAKVQYWTLARHTNVQIIMAESFLQRKCLNSIIIKVIKNSTRCIVKTIGGISLKVVLEFL
jgi:hypothetical protein